MFTCELVTNVRLHILLPDIMVLCVCVCLSVYMNVFVLYKFECECLQGFSATEYKYALVLHSNSLVWPRFVTKMSWAIKPCVCVCVCVCVYVLHLWLDCFLYICACVYM